MTSPFSRDGGSGPQGRSRAFSITLDELHDGRLRVSVAGELDLATASQLDDRLGDVMATPRNVVLDLGELTFMDSTGLASIIRAFNQAGTSEAAFEIAAPLPPQPQRLLELTGVMPRLTFTPASPRDEPR